ncbi:MAG: MotA/TolQ/ExbB proton channel family protein, partial [Deltaproteobacteria bacterium]|nr:MotA/TolQ/ExbB proton channel family protein [Deltaproteobacteria bacterium]
VLLILFLMSVLTWATIIYKMLLLKKIAKETERFYDAFWELKSLSKTSSICKNYKNTPLARMFKNFYNEATATPNALKSGTERFKRILMKSTSVEKSAMERFTPFLATTGSTAPFIGLFGTVWGIMNAFRSIGVKGAANLAVVAPGISEALIATAMGLFAAIPAVVGYNHLITKIDGICAEMDNFTLDLLGIVEKENIGSGIKIND